MTQRKINAARKVATVGSATFDAILKVLNEYTDLDKLTGKQIGELIDAMYAQKEYGSNEMYEEMKHWD